MYVSGISAGLENTIFSVDTFLALHDVVGYGIIYVSILSSALPSVIAALLAVLFVRKGISVVNTLIVLTPLLAFYFWPKMDVEFNASTLQMAILHPLLIYITLRTVAPRVEFPFTVLGVNCSNTFYLPILVGIVVCAPLALVFFFGKSYNGLEFSWSYIVFFLLTATFVLAKKKGTQPLEIISLVLLSHTVYFIFAYGPGVLRAVLPGSS